MEAFSSITTARQSACLSQQTFNFKGLKTYLKAQASHDCHNSRMRNHRPRAAAVASNQLFCSRSSIAASAALSFPATFVCFGTPVNFIGA